jgi:hypothetical protein
VNIDHQQGSKLQVIQQEPLLNLFTQGKCCHMEILSTVQYLSSRGPNSKCHSWSPCSTFSHWVSVAHRNIPHQQGSKFQVAQLKPMLSNLITQGEFCDYEHISATGVQVPSGRARAGVQIPSAPARAPVQPFHTGRLLSTCSSVL